MADLKKIALFSLDDQDKAVLFARQLVNLGWEIVTTKETFTLLIKNGLKAMEISNFVGIKDIYPFPPTLHPEIELALTTNKGKSIDLVYDTTYPLSKGIDVGGHTLLALAAKGNRIVVCNKEDMAKVIEQLKKNNNEISLSLRQHLIDKAYMDIAQYYSSLTQNFKAAPLAIRPLLNGENPYQIPADLFHNNDQDPLALGNFKQLSGIPPCFTNMADFDCILKVLCSISQAFDKACGKVPYIVVAAKHGNPCGLAVSWNSPETAIEGALWGNPLAIWGGEVISNFPISKSSAEKLNSSKKREELLGNSKWMLDLVVAPDFSQQAIQILGKNQRRKIFKNKALRKPDLTRSGWAYRMVRGGFLRQPPNNYVLDLSPCKINFPFPEKSYLDSLIIAWATAWFSNHGGNEVAIAKDRKLLGAGGGPSTIDASSNAIIRAQRCGQDLKGSVFAADAFFPFIDAPEELIKAGCVYGLVPGGGKNMKLIKNCFKKHAVNVFYLPEQFRGFCRH